MYVVIKTIWASCQSIEFMHWPLWAKWKIWEIVFDACVMQTLVYGIKVWEGNISTNSHMKKRKYKRCKGMEKIQRKFLHWYLVAKRTILYSIKLQGTRNTSHSKSLHIHINSKDNAQGCFQIACSRTPRKLDNYQKTIKSF